MGCRTPFSKEMGALLAFSPLGVRRAQLDRIEALIPEIVPGKQYPAEYVCYRITLFRPSWGNGEVLEGAALRRELADLLRDASRRAPSEPPGGVFLGLDEVARRCGVSRRTVDRWRGEGLPARWFKARGKVRLGVSAPAFDRFWQAHPRRSVGRRGRTLLPAQRERVLRRARQLAGQGVSSAASASRLLAAETGRSASSMRRLLARHAPGLFRPARRLTAEARTEIARRCRQGESAASLAREFGVSRSAASRAARRAWLEEVLSVPVKCVGSEGFSRPGAEEEMLGPEGLAVPEPAFSAPPPKPPPGLPPYLQELYQFPLLSREQEAFLFRKYNFVKWRMARLQGHLRRSGFRRPLAEEFEACRKAADSLKSVLTRCNLRLVVSVAKRHAGPMVGLFDLVSDGNVCLMRAVECFDCSRGTRFSTYATWALTKHYARAVPQANYRMAGQLTGQDQLLGELGDHRMDVAAFEERLEHLRSVLGAAVQRLRPRERHIIETHYGLGRGGAAPKTLEEIAAAAGVSRERVRQVEQRALERLRWLLGQEAGEMVAT